MSGSLSDILRNVRSQGKKKEVVNIIDFIESKWGLSPPGVQAFRPYPAQRVILKAHYGIALDNSYRFKMPKTFHKKEFYDFTEKEYLQYLYDEGRCNTGEVIEGHERRKMVLSVGRRSGKCVNIDEYILTDRGIVKAGSLGDLDGEEYQPLRIEVAQEGEKKSHSAYFYNGGHRDTIKYKTKLGFDLEGTPNHRVKVMGSEGKVVWKYLEDLEVGDYVAYHKNTDLWSNKNSILENGLTLNKELAHIAGKHLVFPDELPSQYHFLSSNHGTLLKVMSSKKEVVKYFLQGFLLQEGDEVNPDFIWTNEFTKEIQILLLNIGVVSERNNDTSIKILNPATLSLELDLPIKGGDAIINDDFVIPNQTDLLNKESATYHDLLDLLEEAELDEDTLDHVKYLLDLDYVYTEITEIEHGESYVCDLNVPDGHSFVCNGCVNHNTTISAAIVAYEVYKLIEKVNPHLYYGITPSNLIQMMVVATSKDQASLLYAEASGHFRNSSYFKPYAAKNTQSYAQFQTPKDIEDFGPYSKNPDARMGIKISFKSCNPRSLRGSGNIVIIMDEAAHFADTGQATAEEVYEAVSPSMAQYSEKDMGDGKSVPVSIGPVESRMIMISSPMGEEGFFYEQYRSGFDGSDLAKDMLCVQAPTWEVNLPLDAKEFISAHKRNPSSFWVEFGARFDVSGKTWIERKSDIRACIEEGRKPAYKAPARMPHFIGIDVALKNDYTAIAIGHLDDQGRVVVDLVDRIKAGEGQFKHLERLTLDHISKWIKDYCQKFHIVGGLYDQHLGHPFEDALRKHGLTKFEQINLTRPMISDLFGAFKTLMFEQRISFYNFPVEEKKEFCPYLEELSKLVETKHSKNVSTVEAPRIKGAHDDMSDALVRMVWIASKQFGNKKYISKGYGNRDRSLLSPHAKRLNSRRRLNGGSHPSRNIPKKQRRFGRKKGW